jgi:2-oxoglutarate dehydrogenase E1 component
MHIDDPAIRRWVSDQLETIAPPPSADVQRRIADRLLAADVFEEFVRKKYVGAKTFSLAGAETLVPLLDLAIDHAAAHGAGEIVVGMAHRGRLNVLVNVIGQPPREVFAQFEDKHPEHRMGGGDVKYHLGASGDRKTADGRRIHLSMCFNPSHLEFVSPVVLGRLRAKQDRIGYERRQQGLALIVHGDASFSGQGVNFETLGLHQLAGYHVGGALHVIVNNQLGFTTPPVQGRSSAYASDVALMLQSPILHVNGDHPEAVARALQIALDFRAAYHRDVVIDLYVYRQWGHNEADEPSFTQPQMYQAIAHHQGVCHSYIHTLIDRHVLTREQADEKRSVLRQRLADEWQAAQQAGPVIPPQPAGVWNGYFGGCENTPAAQQDAQIVTGVRRSELERLLDELTKLPDNFHLHKNLKRSIDRRKSMMLGEEPLEWSTAEALAIATLAIEGHRIRIVGQDTQRGTFSQRHAVLHDAVDGHQHCVFADLASDKAPIEIVNSPLHEAGAIGFEYGYSLDFPEALVAWEAQFGDFANAGQVMIDQFIASAEDKWRRLSGLVLLLPHGYEGQGPEHSSARLERFLMLCAENNIQVAMPSTPAQYFHVLRRQVLRKWRKPLIIFTPKSLLRHRGAVSPLEDFTHGTFKRVLPDDRIAPMKTSRVLLCSGKVYYDLLAYREQHQRNDVAIIRIEQFYPLADAEFNLLNDYDPQVPLVWVQEEPENMGAAPNWKQRFGNSLMGRELQFVTRLRSASPATGSHAAHELEQEHLVKQAMGEAARRKDPC